MESRITTTDGRNVYSYDYIERLRAVEKEKRNKKQLSRTFISQTGAQEYVQFSEADLDGTGGNRGGGKANPYYTPVATPTGFRKMGDLKVGDYICTPYEGIQQVKEIFEQGEHTVYVLHFDDGTTVTCMDNHRFLGRIHQDEPWMVWEAREIFDHYKIDVPFPSSLRRNNGEYFEIPLCGEVELTDKRDVDLPLLPFFAGYAASSGFYNFEHGVEISSRIQMRQYAYMAGYKIRTMKLIGKSYITSLTSKQRRVFTSKKSKIAAHIPDVYMYASVESRWDYIKGVLYGCGKSKKKHPLVEMPNYRFCKQLAQMARSLGAWAKIVEVDDNPDRAGWWRVLFKAPNEKKFWKDKRYDGNAHIWMGQPTKAPSSSCDEVMTKRLLYINKSKKKAPCRCITVTGKDHLYLTDEYTINHNTAMLLTKPLPDTNNRYFNGIILRKNKKDFDNIINEIDKWYSPLGRYNKSNDDMTFYFNSGAHLSLTHFDMSLQQFDDRVRGQQYAYIGIDEVTQLPFDWFKILMRSNRNTSGIKSRMLFTCNPDPLSWFRTFIDWYIGKEDTIYADGKMHPERKGLVIPERSGKIRYFYSPSDNVSETIWGNTPHEVYLQIKDIADKAWDDKLATNGRTRENFMVKSFRFTKADLMDNKELMERDPDYYTNLLQAPPEIRERELGGNWDTIRMGDDTIQPYHLDKCFHNMMMLGDRVRRASCDVAGTGGDNCVTWFRIGNHLQDVFVCQKDPYSTVPLLKAKLKEWGVLEQNFTYDLQGMGQLFTGAFPDALPFNNQESCDGDDRNLYDCRKSQAAYLFAQHTQQAEWSIEPTLLDREYTVGGVTMKLYNILQTERKAIRQDMSKQDRGWCLIHKEQMKSKLLVGHSPDFIEALLMFEIFGLKNVETEIPIFLSNHIKSIRTFDFN